MKFQIAIFFALVLTIAAHSTIKCYQDNDVVDCPSGTCLNSTAEVDGDKAIVRSCNPVDIDGSAYCVNTSIPDLGVQGKVCFCHTDFCNSSTYIAMNYAILYGSIIILLLVVM